MPRKPKSKTGAGKWTDGLDPKEVQAALEEATVDAYDEYEQHTGLVTMVQDQVVFPFRARVLGEEVDVVDMKCRGTTSSGWIWSASGAASGIGSKRAAWNRFLRCPTAICIWRRIWRGKGRRGDEG